jgi:Uma2 family endonuclease
VSSSALKEKTAYEKWLQLPENVVGEIVMGELHVNPRPAPKHGNAASSLLMEIAPFHKGRNGSPGGWLIMIEPEIHIENNITVPDIAGWKRTRMPVVPEEAFFSLAPDWICEVLSPSTAVWDRVNKMPLYAKQEVRHFWIIDPILKTMEVYQNDHLSWKLICTYANDNKIRAAPFADIEIDLSALWA